MAKPLKKPKTLSELFNILENEGGDDVLHYTPAKDEPIEISAPIVVSMMLEKDMDAEIHFKNFILEVERDQSPEFIVEAYYGALDIVKEIMAERRKDNKGPKR